MASKCAKCLHDYVCCNGDAWAINLTTIEATVFPHVRAPDGQYIIASSGDGYCCYFDREQKSCQCYNNRPEVCRKFDCDGKEAKMQDLTRIREENKEEQKNKFAGFMTAFVYKNDKQKISSKTKITDVETLKDIYLDPVRVFGETDQEVKDKMIDLLKTPFQQENI